MTRSQSTWTLLASLATLAACSSDDDGSPPPVDLFGGYANGSLTVPTRQPIADLLPVNPAASITGYAISPALPAGLSLDPVTGVIAGNPTGLAAPQVYTVTATDGSANDAEALTIEVRTPIVGLSSDRPLVRSIAAAGSPLAPTGTGVTLTGVAPTPGFVTVTETDLSAPANDDTVVAAVNGSSLVPGLPSGPVDLTADLAALITIDDDELDDDDLWTFAPQAPYDDDGITANLPFFAFDSPGVVLEDGVFGLDVELPAESIGPFDSGTLPTEVREVSLLTMGTDALSSTWLELDGAYYMTAMVGANTEVYRYDPDGGVGGAPVFELAIDLNPAVNGSAALFGVVDGRLLVNLSDTNGDNKLHAYDPDTDEVIQVSNTASGSIDIIGDLVELDGDLYFSGANAVGQFKVYRYTFAADPDPAALELISSTAEGGANDNPQDLSVLDGMLYFLADDPAGDRQLYRFDPATNTQERLSDDGIAPLERMVVGGGEIYVTGLNDQGVQKLFRWNAAAGELDQISNTIDDPGLSDTVVLRQVVQGNLYFEAFTGSGLVKLYRYVPDLTGGTIQQVTNTAGDAADDMLGLPLFEFGDRLLFTAQNPTGDIKLFALDLGTLEARQIVDINGSTQDDSFLGLLAIDSARIAFAAVEQPAVENKVFTYDFETGETLQLADINPAGSDLARPVAVIDGQLVFVASTNVGAVSAYTVE